MINWIPVDHAMPIDDRDVLVHAPPHSGSGPIEGSLLDGPISVARTFSYFANDGEDHIKTWGVDQRRFVTHWRPLPESPVTPPPGDGPGHA